MRYGLREKGGMEMTSSQRKKCETIIHSASVAAAGAAAGLAQIPGADNAAIIPIQVAMIISLGQVFGRELTKNAAVTIIGTATASTVGRTVSQFLVGWIPGLGNAINAGTAASVTEALGWTIANGFDDDAF